MSGGERKKRTGDRGQGWEEAGAEFYQESYPAAAIEADLQQALQMRDPSHIATLLPSKKSRVATTQKRVRHNEPRTTLRRCTSTRTRYATGNTTRRMSTNVQDAAVSMLPDLSENLSNEERTWDEIMQIKSMPVRMEQKIQLKRQLQSATKLRLQGLDQLRWRRRKAWQTLCSRTNEASSKLELWSSSFKKIGGNFGTGVVAFFLFIKWILYLNLVIFAVIAIFLIVPAKIFDTTRNASCLTTNDTSAAICCAELYTNRSREYEKITDLFQGSNYLGYTMLFYGAYPSTTYTSNGGGFHYDFPLAYMSTMIIVFAISLVTVVRSSVKSFRERIMESEGQFYRYCNFVFGGWNYCINNDKAKEMEHKALYNVIRGQLQSEKFEEERLNRTREEKFKLWLVRVFVNLIVLSILGLCGVFIYYLVSVSFEEIYNAEATIKPKVFIVSEKISHLCFEFLPFVAIVILNVSVPKLFQRLIILENYSPPTVIRLTLFRTIFLRLSAIAVIISRLYTDVISSDVDEDQCTNSRRPLCWENFAGQQFLKLYCTDLVGQFVQTFFINFPRSMIVRHSKSKVLRAIGYQEFHLPKHILDIVYLQTICWIGVSFVPFLPLIGVVGSFFQFYIKKFACLVNCRPSNHVYHASRSQMLFMLILLVCYVLVIIPIGYYVVKIGPSKACGPYKELITPWSLVVATFARLPVWFRSLMNFLGTAGFGVPAFIVLTLVLYYYYAVSTANKNMVMVLKNQLVLEGHDKQFLLNRLSAFIKQQQEQTKYQQDLNDFT